MAGYEVTALKNVEIHDGQILFNAQHCTVLKDKPGLKKSFEV